jgi:hypothetical protein
MKPYVAVTPPPMFVAIAKYATLTPSAAIVTIAPMFPMEAGFTHTDAAYRRVDCELCKRGRGGDGGQCGRAR